MYEENSQKSARAYVNNKAENQPIFLRFSKSSLTKERLSLKVLATRLIAINKLNKIFFKADSTGSKLGNNLHITVIYKRSYLIIFTLTYQIKCRPGKYY